MLSEQRPREKEDRQGKTGRERQCFVLERSQEDRIAITFVL